MTDGKKMVFVTERDSRYGFSLAGFEQYDLPPEESEAFLERLIKQKEIGIIVIDERLVAEDERD